LLLLHVASKLGAGYSSNSFGNGPPKKAAGIPGQRRISQWLSQSPEVLFPQLVPVLQTAPPPVSSPHPALSETLPPVAPCLAGLPAQVFEGMPRSASEESRCTLDLPWSPVFGPAAGGLPEGPPPPPSAGLGGGAGSAPGSDTPLPLFPIFSFDGPSLGAGLSLPLSIDESTALTIKATWRSRDSPLSPKLTADTVGCPTPPSMPGSGGTADTA
jgi:hypothetical protein